VSALRPLLDRHVAAFDAAAHVPRDPLQFPHRYVDSADVEVVGFLAATLAFGRVAAFSAVVDPLLGALGPRPAVTLRSLEGGTVEAAEAADDAVRAAAARRYRWLGPDDLEALLRAVGALLREHGSLEAAFVAHDPGGPDTWPALGGLLDDLRERARAAHPDPDGRARALAFVFPSTKGAAACKRQHLFLRWMVRGEPPDLGLWSSVDPARLVMPCDTHTARIGHALGLCARPGPGRRTADELTAALRAMCPEDPVRYDFALCHLGISGGCRGRRIDAVCTPCDLRRACRWT